MRTPACFLDYRDEGQCLLQDNAVCRCCKAGTFILMRRVRDGEIAARETTLRECLRLNRRTVRRLGGRGA